MWLLPRKVVLLNWTNHTGGLASYPGSFPLIGAQERAWVRG